MMPDEIQLLRDENVRLRQKNDRLNALLQFLQKPVQPVNTIYRRPRRILQKPGQPLNTTNIRTPNEALLEDLLDEIKTLREEKARFQHENADLAKKVRTLVDDILQDTFLQYR